MAGIEVGACLHHGKSRFNPDRTLLRLKRIYMCNIHTDTVCVSSTISIHTHTIDDTNERQQLPPPLYMVLRLGWASMTLLALSSFVVPYVDRLADHGKLLAAASPAPGGKGSSSSKGKAPSSSTVGQALDFFLHRCMVRTGLVEQAGAHLRLKALIESRKKIPSPPQGAQALVLALLRRLQPLDRPPALVPLHRPPTRSPPSLLLLIIATGALAFGPGRPRAPGGAGPAAAVGVPLPLPLRRRTHARGRCARVPSIGPAPLSFG
jgi:hypothetical protein